MSDRGEQVALELLTKGWEGLLAGHGRGLLEAALPGWLGRQRWFGAKTRTISGLRIARWAEVPTTAAGAILAVGTVPPASSLGDVLLVLELSYADGSGEVYQVPLGFATGAAVEVVRASSPASIVLAVGTPTGEGIFHDATVREEFRQSLLGLIEHGNTLPLEEVASASAHVAATLIAAHESRPAHEITAAETREIAAAIVERHSIEPEDVAPSFVGHMPGAGNVAEAAEPTHVVTGATLAGAPSEAFVAVRGAGHLAARLGSAEQSNTNILYGQRLIMKVFRRLQPGYNPDVEIGRFLTEVAHFPRIAPFLGELTLTGRDGEHTTTAMLQGLVANEGDGWEWTLRELRTYYEGALGASLRDPGEAGSFNHAGHTAAEVKSLAGEYLGAAALLGRRTAEMHLALATSTDDAAFAAETVTAADLERDALRVGAQIGSALDALAARAFGLDSPASRAAEAVLALRHDLMQRANSIAGGAPSGQRIRIHGDYHLGQVLRAQNDFVLLDFEGEPARSLAERRQKQSPLRDVAGMLRSFSYAAYAGLKACAAERQEELMPWAQAWERAACTEFLDAYREAAGTSPTLLPEAAQAQALLNGYLLEKALYELLYELNNRPEWVAIPMAGILALPA